MTVKVEASVTLLMTEMGPSPSAPVAKFGYVGSLLAVSPWIMIYFEIPPKFELCMFPDPGLLTMIARFIYTDIPSFSLGTRRFTLLTRSHVTVRGNPAQEPNSALSVALDASRR